MLQADVLHVACECCLTTPTQSFPTKLTPDVLFILDYLLIAVGLTIKADRMKPLLEHRATLDHMNSRQTDLTACDLTQLAKSAEGQSSWR